MIAAFVLVLCGGCGDNTSSISAKKEEVVSLTPVEKAEVDKYIQERGRKALVYYLYDEDIKQMHNTERMDEQRVLKYVKYLVSQGADVNAKGYSDLTPLDYANGAELIKFLKSKGAVSRYDMRSDMERKGTEQGHSEARSALDEEVQMVHRRVEGVQSIVENKEAKQGRGEVERLRSLDETGAGFR